MTVIRDVLLDLFMRESVKDISNIYDFIAIHEAAISLSLSMYMSARANITNSMMTDEDKAKDLSNLRLKFSEAVDKLNIMVSVQNPETEGKVATNAHRIGTNVHPTAKPDHARPPSKIRLIKEK